MLRNDLEDSIDVNNLARVLKRIAEARHPDALITIEACRDWIEFGLGAVVPDIDELACRAAMGEYRDGIAAVRDYLVTLRTTEQQERVP